MRETRLGSPPLGGYTEEVYALTRFVVGFLFACHGAQKLLGVFGPLRGAPSALDPIAGVIELAGGVMVALGLLAGPAAFIASGEMAVAYFMVHASNGFWPILNNGEKAALFCFIFLFIAARGSGRYSVDALRARLAARRAQRPAASSSPTYTTRSGAGS